MTPVKAATGLAEEDDVSISQLARHETPVWLPPDNVIFKFQPLIFLAIHWSMYPSMLDIDFLLWITN